MKKNDIDRSTPNKTKEEALSVLKKDRDKIKKEAESLSRNYQNKKAKP